MYKCTMSEDVGDINQGNLSATLKKLAKESIVFEPVTQAKSLSRGGSATLLYSSEALLELAFIYNLPLP